MRLASMNAIGPKPLDFSVSDDVQEMARGTYLDAVGTDFDATANVPNWGAAQLLYVGNTGGAVLPGTLVVLDKNFRIAATAASEANTGRPVYVALTHFAVGSTTEQFGWVLRSGICPIRYSVAATAGNVFGGTAGVATPTAAVGVQILNARCIIAAAGSFTRQVTPRTGSSRVRVATVAGLFVGQAVSGTGIPASSVVSAIGEDGTSFVIGSAVGTPVSATASNSVTGTFTHTGFGICQVDSPTFQSQIT